MSIKDSNRRKEYNRRYYLEHKEEISSRRKKVYLEKRGEKKKPRATDDMKAYRKAYREKNLERLKEYAREYRRTHKDKERDRVLRYRRTHREETHDYYNRRNNSIVGQANNAVTNAIKSSRLSRSRCEVCGNEKAEAHHDDYNKPLEVRWLCKKCHMEWHKNNSPIYKDDIA